MRWCKGKTTDRYLFNFFIMRYSPYPLYVWFTSLFFAPVIFFLVLDISEGFSYFGETSISLIFTSFLVGIVVSLPSFIIYFTVFQLLKHMSVLKAKILLCLCAICCMSLTFDIIIGRIFSLFQAKGDPFDNPFFAYAISIIISSFVYRYRE